MNKKLPLALATVTLCAAALTVPAMAADTCGVVEGPTPITGDTHAKSDKDITIYNDKIAVSFAVGSNNYWNMTRGSVLDVGIRSGNGDYGVDITNDAQFLLDLWSATGSYNGEDLLNDVDCTYAVNEAKDEVSITMKTRFWSADADKNGVNDDVQFGAMQKPLNVTTTWTLKEGNNYMTMNSVVENPADNKVVYEDMRTGYSISTQAKFMYGPFGYYPDIKTQKNEIGVSPNVQEPLGTFVTTYSSNYAMTASMDDADCYKGSSGYKDIYKMRDIKPGDKNTYDGELLAVGESETASVLARYMERNDQMDQTATVTGTVTDADGKPVEGAYVMVKKDGSYYETQASYDYTSGKTGVPAETKGTAEMTLVWDITDANGNYSFVLPKTGWDDGTGINEYTYKLKVEASGYSASETEVFELNGDMTQDLQVKPGADIQFKAVDENGDPVPFKVVISGMKADMKCLGGTVFFSDANAKDRYGLDFTMSQSDGKTLTFTATNGAGFESKAATYEAVVGEDGLTYTFVIPSLIDPEAKGWYAMDNHNHSNFGDGSTTPEDLYSIQIAENLDTHVVTDHDGLVNNAAMADMAKRDGRIFISGDEVSPGWGHWNILNMPYSNPVSPLDASAVTPQDIINYGHGLDGAIVNLNHPYSNYGYLYNQESVKGGHDEGWDGFDLLELQSTMDLTGMDALTAAQWKGIDRQHLYQTIPADYANEELKTMISAMAFWNEGMPKYLNAGSDAHDAHDTNLFSGKIRAYVQTESQDVDGYLDALMAGHSYITMGPVLFPAETNMFGETITANVGDALTLKMDVQAVNGMDKVYLWRNGVCIGVKELNGATELTEVAFETKAAAGEHVWYSFTAVDSNGNWAATNPVWLDNGGVKGFNDVVPENWYFDAAVAMDEAGLMNGTNGNFNAGDKLTRAMLMTMLARLDGEDTNGGATWYEKGMNWAKDNGISDGKNPNGNVTREQVATMLYRYAQMNGEDVSASGDLNAFNDGAKTSAWAAEAMQWAVGADVLNGSKGNLNPQGTASRAEVAQILYNYLF